MNRFYYGDNPYAQNLYSPFANNIAGGVASFGSKIPQILGAYQQTMNTMARNELLQQKNMLIQEEMEAKREERERSKQEAEALRSGFGNFLKAKQEHMSKKGADGWAEWTPDQAWDIFESNMLMVGANPTQYYDLGKTRGITPMTAKEKAADERANRAIKVQEDQFNFGKKKYGDTQAQDKLLDDKWYAAIDDIQGGVAPVDAAANRDLTQDQTMALLNWNLQQDKAATSAQDGLSTDMDIADWVLKGKGATPLKTAAGIAEAQKRFERDKSLSTKDSSFIKGIVANALEEKITTDSKRGRWRLDLKNDNLVRDIIDSPLGAYLGVGDNIVKRLQAANPHYRIEDRGAGVYDVIPKGRVLTPQDEDRYRKTMYDMRAEIANLSAPLEMIQQKPNLIRWLGAPTGMFQSVGDYFALTPEQRSEKASALELRSMFETFDKKFLNEKLRAMSGAAVTEPEFKRLDEQFSKLGPEGTLAKYRAYMSILEATYNAYEGMLDSGVIDNKALRQTIKDTVDGLIDGLGNVTIKEVE